MALPTRVRGVGITNPAIAITRHHVGTHVCRYHGIQCQSIDQNKRGIPTPEEDKEVMHEAFLHAFEISRPEQCRIPGMQEFASAILAREKIPSQQYSDPLGHIFDEVDANGDSRLSAGEVGQALRSHDIEITDDQVSMFMKALSRARREENGSEDDVCVEKKDFRDLIVHMAAADFQCSQLCENSFETDSVTSCTIESDDDVQRTLEAWRSALLHSGVIPTATVSLSSSTESSSMDEE